jgi:radical SAM-linked protein
MSENLSPQQRLRLTFAKHDALKYISHLDLARTWERAFRRASLPLAYSQGFNPRPRFQIAAALPVGVTSEVELIDIWLVTPLVPDQALDRLRAVLPPGLEALDAGEVELRAKSLQSQMRSADYRAVVATPEQPEALAVRVEALLASPSLPRQRHHKGKLQAYDMRPLIQTLSVGAGPDAQCELTMRLQSSPQGAGRPDQVLDALGLSQAIHSIERTNLQFEFDK